MIPEFQAKARAPMDEAGRGFLRNGRTGGGTRRSAGQRDSGTALKANAGTSFAHVRCGAKLEKSFGPVKQKSLKNRHASASQSANQGRGLVGAYLQIRPLQ